MNRWITAALAVAVLLTGSCKRSTADDESNTTAEIETMTVKPRDLTTTVDYPATMRGEHDVAILPQIESRIVKVLVAEGQRVRAGQPLFILDGSTYRASLATSRANLQAARARLFNVEMNAASSRKLREKHIVSDFEVRQQTNLLREARAVVAQAAAEMDNARASLSYTVVRSPSAGVVGSLPYKPGAMASPTMTTPLTYVSDNGSMVAYFSLSQNQYTSLLRLYGSKDKALSKMPAVSWQMNDGSRYEHQGRVATISGLLDPQTGTVSVRAVFPNDGGLLISGATGNVIMPTTLHHVLVVPQSAVSQLQDKYFVNRIVGGKTRRQLVKVSTVGDGKHFIISSRLRAGDISARTMTTYIYTMKYRGRLSMPEQFGNIVIRSLSDGQVLRLRDVARVELGSDAYNYHTGMDGHPTPMLTIQQTAGSNASAIINEINAIPDDFEYCAILSATLSVIPFSALAVISLPAFRAWSPASCITAAPLPAAADTPKVTGAAASPIACAAFSVLLVTASSALLAASFFASTALFFKAFIALFRGFLKAFSAFFTRSLTGLGALFFNLSMGFFAAFCEALRVVLSALSSLSLPCCKIISNSVPAAFLISFPSMAQLLPLPISGILLSRPLPLIRAVPPGTAERAAAFAIVALISLLTTGLFLLPDTSLPGLGSFSAVFPAPLWAFSPPVMSLFSAFSRTAFSFARISSPFF